VKSYPSMAKQEKEWQAECDARLLADAASVTADPKRFESAKSKADKLAKEKQEEATHLSAIAKGLVAYPSMSA
jgi:hypothetical protein